MTYQRSRTQIAALKKHERSIKPFQPEPDLGYLAGSTLSAASLEGLQWPLWRLLPAALLAQWQLWRERMAARDRLAGLSRQALADLALDPGQAAFEAERPFWQPHQLRRVDPG